MTLIRKTSSDFLFHPFLEFLIVTISLIAILVPLRIFTKIALVDDWIGSLGIISVVFGIILVLSKKEKLGIFGQMFMRQILRSHKGKSKWVLYIQTGLFLSIGIFTIISIHSGNTEFSELKDQVVAKFASQGVVIDSTLNFDTIDKISSQVSPDQQIGAISALPLLGFQNYDVFSVVLAVTDQMMGGWVMYFWQIMVVETIEIMIFLCITRKYLFKNIVKN